MYSVGVSSNNRASYLITIKIYHNLRVPWYTHLYRAGLGIFCRSDQPWHTYVYRAWRGFWGDPRYLPAPAKFDLATAALPAKALKTQFGEVFQAARREAGV